MDCQVFFLIVCSAVLQTVALSHIPTQNPEVGCIVYPADPLYQEKLCNIYKGSSGWLPERTFVIGHPIYCNAYIKCNYSPGPLCFFCPKGTYYSLNKGRCVATKDVGNFCGVRLVIAEQAQWDFSDKHVCIVNVLT